MQFKYPEILWGLLLLCIPIIIHLFQLRRFKKTPFTNVKFLKQVISESRKSSTLKKWLILLTRLGLILALVIAFAQPFIANNNALKEKEAVYYLDDSFSMNGQNENGNIFQHTIQEFIKSIPKDQYFSLFTNKKVFKNVTIKDIQNELLDLRVSSEQLAIPEILLKGNTFFSKETNVVKNLVLISDFQQRMGVLPLPDSLKNINVYYVKPTNTTIINSSIDSVYINASTGENLEIVAQLSTNSSEKTIPVSLFNKDVLIAKTAAKFDENHKAEVSFTINTKDVVLGKVAITDSGLAYDNQFYFNIDEKSKIKVLIIGDASHGFLNRIFLNNEFKSSTSTLAQLNYSTIDNQNLVILNEVQKIPNSLITSLNTFHSNGGSIVLIPNMDGDLVSYNQLSALYNTTKYGNTIPQNIAISNVKIGHSLYNNVFEKTVTDFQFPTVEKYFRLTTNALTALEFQNKEPFLTGSSNAYFFSAALNSKNSNFKNSPLIVPTFYNMGLSSLKQLPLYVSLESSATIDIPLTLQQDDVIKIVNNENEFIPQQRVLPKKVQLTFSANPKQAGIYNVMHNDKVIRNISFNDNRKESELLYTHVPESNKNNSLSSFFIEHQKNNAINEFWKWFAILALVFVVLETVLQRFIK